MIWENIRLAFRDLAANKLRTALSLLGIVIGVSSVIVITTLGESATASIESNFAEAGLETLTVFPGRSADQAERFFTLELAEDISNAVPGVAQVIPLQQGQVRAIYRDDSLGATAIATTPAYAEVFDWGATLGSFVTEEDNARRRRSVVLGAQVAEDFFGDEDPVGRVIRLSLGGTLSSFRVTGVMAERSASIGVSFDDRVFVPYQTYATRLARVEQVGAYVVEISPDADPIAVGEGVDEYLSGLTGDENAFNVLSPSTIAETFSEVTGTLSTFLAGIAAISLLVGGIGIMNIMLVAVVERTREIGIRKALGATPAVIRGQFLTEAISLTLIGGGLGVALGTGISALGVRLLDISLAPAYWSYGLALGFSAAVGLFFGLYPAWRASRLDPVQALSYE